MIVSKGIIFSSEEGGIQTDIKFSDYTSDYSFKDRSRPEYKSEDIKFSGSEIKPDSSADEYERMTGIKEHTSSDKRRKGRDSHKRNKEDKSSFRRIKYSDKKSDKADGEGNFSWKEREYTAIPKDGRNTLGRKDDKRYGKDGFNKKSYESKFEKEKKKNGKGKGFKIDEVSDKSSASSRIKYHTGRQAISYVSKIGNKTMSFVNDTDNIGYKETKGLKEIIKKIVTVAVSVIGSAIISPILIAILVCIILTSFTVSIIGSIEGMRTTTTVSPNSANYEERLLYSRLNDYFWDNENGKENTAAVVGILCNIYEESGFKANNLQNSYELTLGMSDDAYTDAVNNGTYSKDSFISDSAGYGYCQYTIREKKQSLYEYADNWFNNEEGIGYGQTFDIASPEMQSYYVVYLLDELYPATAEKLKELTTKYDQSTEEGWEEAVYEATYIWLTDYERPDPQYTLLNGSPCNNYYEVATVRATNANTIYNICTSTDYLSYSGDFLALEGTYFVQTESGPCVFCSICNMLKRYCYMSGDASWDEITPDLITDSGKSLHDDIVSAGTSVCGWGCIDLSGTVHHSIDTGFSAPTSGQTVSIHGIACNIHYVSGCPSKDEIITLLQEHPEGIAVTGTYSGGAHGKVLTRYDDITDDFYCVDPGAWGSSTHSSLSSDAAGRYEMKLSESRCWTSISSITYYRYIGGDN
mgnify:CR=1 FL=1